VAPGEELYKERVMVMRWIVLGVLLGVATASQAADETGKRYLNPQVGWLRATAR